MEASKGIHPQNGFTAEVLAAWHRGEIIQVFHPHRERWEDSVPANPTGSITVIPAPYRYRIKPKSFKVELTFEQAALIESALCSCIAEFGLHDQDEAEPYEVVRKYLKDAENNA